MCLLTLLEALDDAAVVSGLGGEPLERLPSGGVGRVDGDGALVLELRRDRIAVGRGEEVAELDELLRRGALRRRELGEASLVGRDVRPVAELLVEACEIAERAPVLRLDDEQVPVDLHGAGGVSELRLVDLGCELEERDLRFLVERVLRPDAEDAREPRPVTKRVVAALEPFQRRGVGRLDHEHAFEQVRGGLALEELRLLELGELEEGVDALGLRRSDLRLTLERPLDLIVLFLLLAEPLHALERDERRPVDAERGFVMLQRVGRARVGAREGEMDRDVLFAPDRPLERARQVLALGLRVSVHRCELRGSLEDDGMHLVVALDLGDERRDLAAASEHALVPVDEVAEVDDALVVRRSGQELPLHLVGELADALCRLAHAIDRGHDRGVVRRELECLDERLEGLVFVLEPGLVHVGDLEEERGLPVRPVGVRQALAVDGDQRAEAPLVEQLLLLGVEVFGGERRLRDTPSARAARSWGSRPNHPQWCPNHPQRWPWPPHRCSCSSGRPR